MEDTTTDEASGRTSSPGRGRSDRVSVAGVVFEALTADAADRELLTRVLGTASSDGPVDVRLEIGDAPAVPARTPDFEGPYGDHWDDGVTHSFRHSWGLTMTADADRVRLGGTSTGFARWVAVRNSMLFALARVFLARGRFVLHAAAIRRAEQALVIVGDSGTGKSTFAWAASRWGCEVLGDDMVVVDHAPDGASLRVQGIARVPSIPGDLARAELVAGDRLPEDERNRMELAEFRLDPRPCLIQGVVRCGHSTAAATLEPLPTHEALRSLVPAFVLSALEEPLRRWFPVAVELARTHSVTHSHDADLRHRVEAVGRHLDQLLPLVSGDPESHTIQRPNLPDATSSR